MRPCVSCVRMERSTPSTGSRLANSVRPERRRVRSEARLGQIAFRVRAVTMPGLLDRRRVRFVRVERSRLDQEELFVRHVSREGFHKEARVQFVRQERLQRLERQIAQCVQRGRTRALSLQLARCVLQDRSVCCQAQCRRQTAVSVRAERTHQVKGSRSVSRALQGRFPT